MNTPIDEIKSKIDIVEYIGAIVPLKKAGRNFKGLCPFHDEKTPSFMVSPDRQLWRCFGACQEGGDIIAFVMKFDNLTFFETLKELAQKTGVKLESVDFEDRAWQKKDRMLSANTLAADYFHYILTKHKAGVKAKTYLQERGISDKIIETFRLGYAPDNWDSLFLFLQKKKFLPQELFDAGLVIRSQKGGVFDRFRGRLMFPIVDPRDHIIAFAGRIINPSTSSGQAQSETSYQEAKYINTPETLLYKKRETLFGIHLAKKEIQKKNQAVIVEGEFDMISCFSHGITNTVAIKGSAFTIEQLRLLKRYTNHLILSLDADFSGTQTARRAIADASNLDFRVEVCPLTFAKDPDEALHKDPIVFKKALQKPVPIYDYLIDVAVKSHSSEDAFDKKEAADEVIPFISDIENPIVKSHYIKKFSDLLDIEPQSIDLSIQRHRRAQKEKSGLKIFRKEKEKNRYEILQQYVMSSLFQNSSPPRLYQRFAETLHQDDFTNTSYQKLLEKLQEEKDNKNFDINAFAAALPPEQRGVLDTVFLLDITMFPEELTEKNFEKSVLELKKISLKLKIKKYMTTNTTKDESVNLNKITKQLTDIEKRLAVL